MWHSVTNLQQNCHQVTASARSLKMWHCHKSWFSLAYQSICMLHCKSLRLWHSVTNLPQNCHQVTASAKSLKMWHCYKSWFSLADQSTCMLHSKSLRMWHSVTNLPQNCPQVTASPICVDLRSRPAEGRPRITLVYVHMS